MRENKYLAGFGIVCIFIGIFCFRAIFMKSKPIHHVDTTLSAGTKVLLAIFGLLSMGAGVFLIYRAIKNIS